MYRRKIEREREYLEVLATRFCHEAGLTRSAREKDRDKTLIV